VRRNVLNLTTWARLAVPRLRRRPPFSHAHAERGHSEGFGERVRERLSRALRGGALAALEGRGEREHACAMDGGAVELDRPDPFALVIDSFLGLVETLVVREGH